MALSSSQIYVATYSTGAEKMNTTSNARKEPAHTSRWRFGRSTTNLRDANSRASGRTSSTRRDPSPPPSEPKLERPASKMSLFSLFSKPKVERARGHTEVGLAVPMRPSTPPKSQPPVSAPKSSLRQNPSPPAQQTIRARSSQMFSRPMSMRPPPPPPKEFGNWDPPPLFQAFPQSVKHATVQACVFAPEMLMRTQSQRRQAEVLRERMDSVRDLSIIEEDGSEAKRSEKTHKRLISNSVLNPPAPELVNKIYILVTAGFVLQYAGDGSFDRKPEKVLKLGKESAAFACDLIPGKHWVLQISSHAHDDGTPETGPKSSLLSRLRTQNVAVNKAATSFLLVLDSAEEMDAWMTVVRKEIDNQGGMKARAESSRASSSTDETRDTKSSETTSHRYRVQRDSTAPSKIVPIDSPFQSQYSSPKIVTSEWASNRSERTVSIAESSSGHSNRYGTQRQSMESSVVETPVSQDQVQLDSLRGRSRFSYMSNATSLSGTGTRSTSRESSPPKSPFQENIPTETEPTRSAMSLKSFHMNPSSSVASRRRSMQPLPVTNEHFTQPASQPTMRHSLYGPASPTMTDHRRPSAVDTIMSVDEPTDSEQTQTPEISTLPTTVTTRPTPPKIQTTSPSQTPVLQQAPAREESPVRNKLRSYSLPPRRDMVSPPPKGPAPLPPPSVSRRQSSLGGPANASTTPISTSDARIQRRVSANPKPFLRPFPVRPQQQHADLSKAVPRRLSSSGQTSGPAPMRLSLNVNRAVTAPVRPPSYSPNMGPTSHPQSYQSANSAAQSRRQSVQTRTSPAPFLLAPSRPARATYISSTPSFVPGRRTSNPQELAPTQTSQRPSSSALREHLPASFEMKSVAPRQSMPAMNLPPPVPPPNMPLPTLPPASSPPTMALPPPPSASTTNIAMPGPPPSMPLPAPPPSAPLPPTPPQLRASQEICV